MNTNSTAGVASTVLATWAFFAGCGDPGVPAHSEGDRVDGQIAVPTMDASTEGDSGPADEGGEGVASTVANVRATENQGGSGAATARDCATAVGNAVIDCGAETIVIESNGLPVHQTMVGIAAGAWNAQWPGEQEYVSTNAFTIPAEVQLADEPTYTVKNAAGVTVNGVPFFFPHAPGREDCLDIAGSDECLRDPVAVGEMDDCGGHTGRGDDYHYHAEPTCLIARLPAGAIVGYMLDGVPMYTEALEGSSPYEGCDGWLSPEGQLHYVFRDSYPYLTSCMLGVFDEGPSTRGADTFSGDLEARQLGSITGYTSDGAGCATMTFSTGQSLTHCR